MRSIFSVLNRTTATAWQPPTRTLRSPRTALKLDSICARCRQHQIRYSSNRQLADDPRWISVVDHPAQVVRAGRKHGPGLIILGIAPRVQLHQLQQQKRFAQMDDDDVNYYVLQL